MPLPPGAAPAPSARGRPPRQRPAPATPPAGGLPAGHPLSSPGRNWPDSRCNSSPCQRTGRSCSRACLSASQFRRLPLPLLPRLLPGRCATRRGRGRASLTCSTTSDARSRPRGWTSTRAGVPAANRFCAVTAGVVAVTPRHLPWPTVRRRHWRHAPHGPQRCNNPFSSDPRTVEGRRGRGSGRCGPGAWPTRWKDASIDQGRLLALMDLDPCSRPATT